VSHAGTGVRTGWQRPPKPCETCSTQVVCSFCEKHLDVNAAAFKDPRLQLIINDARAQLEKADGVFDVIIGDLADPVYGGPCYQVCETWLYAS